MGFDHDAVAQTRVFIGQMRNIGRSCDHREPPCCVDLRGFSRALDILIARADGALCHAGVSGLCLGGGLRRDQRLSDAFGGMGDADDLADHSKRCGGRTSVGLVASIDACADRFAPSLHPALGP